LAYNRLIRVYTAFVCPGKYKMAYNFDAATIINWQDQFGKINANHIVPSDYCGEFRSIVL
jgi:hypothetical protein